MAFEGNSGIQVANHYGPRDTGATVGVERTTKSRNTLSIELTPTGLNDGFLPPLVLPQGAAILNAFLRVDAPITGVTAVKIGARNDEATDGIAFVAADFAAIGTKDVSAKLAGEWEVGAFTTKANVIGLDVTGTASIAAPQGRASLTIEYVYKVRDDSKWEPTAASLARPGYKAQPQV